MRAGLVPAPGTPKPGKVPDPCELRWSYDVGGQVLAQR